MTEVFHYVTDWKHEKVCQMWIEPRDDKFVAVAYDPVKKQSMVMSNPRSHYDTLLWIEKYCGSFCFI